ncbi:MAG: ribose 5-phosphate isomerase B [Verrucomicrobiota bacterium]|nr:ribose 5-phosphate isomerase B [Verrucomicrobiota bacterium]
MRIAVAADHAGFPLKNHLKRVIEARGDTVVDVGAHEFHPADDYPDFAERAGRAIIDGTADRAVLICGSGVGASIAANKLPGVRAAVCHDGYSAHQGVEHDDMNVLVLGSRIVGEALAEELVAAFLNAKFSGEERHVRRLQKVLAIENATQAR